MVVFPPPPPFHQIIPISKTQMRKQKKKRDIYRPKGKQQQPKKGGFARQSVKKVVRKSRKNQKSRKPELSLVLGAAAYMWTTLNNLLGSLILVLLKVLHEEPSELLNLILETGSAVPAVAGVE